VVVEVKKVVPVLVGEGELGADVVVVDKAPVDELSVVRLLVVLVALVLEAVVLVAEAEEECGVVVSVAAEPEFVDEAVELAAEDAKELREHAWRFAFEFASPARAANDPSAG